jgi:hypothetical protein
MDIDDILILIFDLLHESNAMKTLLECRLVCRQWRNIIQERKHIYLEDGRLFAYQVMHNRPFKIRFQSMFITLIRDCQFSKEITARINAYRVKKFPLQKLVSVILNTTPNPVKNHRTIDPQSLDRIYQLIQQRLRPYKVFPQTSITLTDMNKPVQTTCQILNILLDEEHKKKYADNYAALGTNSTEQITMFLNRILWIFIIISAAKN